MAHFDLIPVCSICKIKLDQPDKPETSDCGGDCVKCMADCGDLDCQSSMHKILEEEVKRMIEAEKAYGCGYYGDEAWCKAYDRIAEIVRMPRHGQ